MPSYFRALAIDYDGTIAIGPRPEESILDALGKLRAEWRAVLLVTGRILSELAADFPEVTDHFDAIVAENGAVIWRAGAERAVAPPVSAELDKALSLRGIPYRRGAVILATEAGAEVLLVEECARLGLDHQLVRNRGALMVLPAGISKGTGTVDALGDLGISHHSAIGAGDAENDLALLQACEIGVAVAASVPSLREAADIVLDDRPGALLDFLRLDIGSGLRGIQPRRRRVELGRTSEGEPVTIPASRIQVFIDGPSGGGKSYLAGLLAETLIAQAYTVCIIDMEGDHTALAQLRGAIAVGGREPLPPPEAVTRLVRHRFGSIVIDLSLRDSVTRLAYARDVLDHLRRLREETGLPHWIVIEEAHLVPREDLERAGSRGSLCLVTYMPEWLGHEPFATADVCITAKADGIAALRDPDEPGSEVEFVVGRRAVAHVRHQQKYADLQVPYEQGFFFRTGSGRQGPHVHSLGAFLIEIARVDEELLGHHARRHDFSRWIRDVFRDHGLAKAVGRAEASFALQEAARFRSTVRELIGLRYRLEG